MALPDILKDNLSLPVVGSPMFILSGPDLVIEQCKAGIVGAFPALNARPKEMLDTWLTRINSELSEFKAENPDKKVAPYAVNQIIHPSNSRLMDDLMTCGKHKVPIIITSLMAPDLIVGPVHDNGGLIFHDVINLRHARRAAKAGVDGLILVASGAGGHAGALSPFAIVNEVRKFFDGTILLAGAISNGSDILAAQAMGADLAYMGTRFIATKEANAVDGYKDMVVTSDANDVVYSSLFTGVKGNYLKGSISASGLDPENLPDGEKTNMNFDDMETGAKAWKDIWGAGQGVGSINDIPAVAELIGKLEDEYKAAKIDLDQVFRF